MSEEKTIGQQIQDALHPNKAYKITQAGVKILMRADKISKGEIPNEIKFLSRLRDNKKHPRWDFDEKDYVNPSLDECIKYHLKKGFVIEVNYP